MSARVRFTFLISTGAGMAGVATQEIDSDLWTITQDEWGITSPDGQTAAWLTARLAVVAYDVARMQTEYDDNGALLEVLGLLQVAAHHPAAIVQVDLGDR